MSLSYDEFVSIQLECRRVAIPHANLFKGEVINIVTGAPNSIGFIVNVMWPGRTCAVSHNPQDLENQPPMGVSLGRGKRRMRI